MSSGKGTITPVYTSISDATLTAGKPWTQTLARTLRDNVDHVHSLVHDTVNGHDHDGVNSPLISAAGSFRFPLDMVPKANGSGAKSWTTISIASDTGSDTAKVAVLRIRMNPYTGTVHRMDVRVPGTSPTSPKGLLLNSISGAHVVVRTLLMNLDASEQFEYQVITNGTLDWWIDLESWIL